MTSLTVVFTAIAPSSAIAGEPSPLRRGPSPHDRTPPQSRTKALTLAGLPVEVADGDEHAADAPGGHDKHVCPAERRAEEGGLHAEGEVADREDAGDPQDPGRGGVAERDEDPGEELHRQRDRVDDRSGGVGVGYAAGHREAERAE